MGLNRAEKMNAFDSTMLGALSAAFGELVFGEGSLSSGGVLLIRLAGLSAQTKSQAVSDALTRHAAELPNCFSVISPGRVRLNRKA